MIESHTSNHNGHALLPFGGLFVFCVALSCQQSERMPRPHAEPSTQHTGQSPINAPSQPNDTAPITQPPVVEEVPRDGAEAYYEYCGDDVIPSQAVTSDTIEATGMRCVVRADGVRKVIEIVTSAEPIPKVQGVSGLHVCLKIFANGSTVLDDVLVERDGLVHVGGAFRRLSREQLRRLFRLVSQSCPWEVFLQLFERGRTYQGPLFPRAAQQPSDQ